MDFTGFEWAKLGGIGTELTEDYLLGKKSITIKGTIPPLKILEYFDVKGSEKEAILSSILGFDEDRLLVFAKTKRNAIQICIQDTILYQQEILDNAMTTVVSLLSAAMPQRKDGTSIVEFDLQFENEAAFKKKVEQQSLNAPKACSDTTYYFDG